MQTPAYIRFVAPVAIIALAACGGSSGGVTTPTPPPTPTLACQSTLSLSLAVGEIRPLTAEQAACFSIQTPGSSRYVLAGFDTRGIL